MADDKDLEHARQINQLTSAMLSVRDRLQIIADGEMERGHCVAGERECYGGKPGMRKVKLEDAKNIARHCVAYLNKEISKALWDEKD